MKWSKVETIRLVEWYGEQERLLITLYIVSQTSGTNFDIDAFETWKLNGSQTIFLKVLFVVGFSLKQCHET